MFRQLQQHAEPHCVIVNTLQRQAAKVVLNVFIALWRVGIEVRHNNDLLARLAFMRGDNRAAGGVVPVLTLIAVGIDVAGIKATYVALITHLGKLLTKIIG